MKGLTLTQPWATLVAEGAKHIETRSWATSYRGPILIHAAKGWRRPDMRLALELFGRDVLKTPPSLLPHGAIVARARLVSCVRTADLLATPKVTEWTPLTDAELELGDYTPGRFGWLLTDIVAIDPPIPWRGALSLWEGPDL